MNTGESSPLELQKLLNKTLTDNLAKVSTREATVLKDLRSYLTIHALRNLNNPRTRFHNFKLAIKSILGSGFPRPHSKLNETYSSKVILCLPRMPGHLSQIRPVVRQLEEKWGYEVVYGILGDNISSALNDKEKRVDLYSKSRVSPQLGLFRCLQFLKGLRQSSMDESLFNDISDPIFQLLPKYFVFESALINCLDKIRPVGMIVGNPYSWEGRLASRLAVERNIPSFAIQHGTISFPDDNWKDCQFSKFAVWGESSKANLIKNGIPPSSIVVTGSPALDTQLQNSDPKQKLDVVIVATSGPGDLVSLDQHKSFIHSLRACAESNKNLKFIIKLHPKDSASLYQDLPSANTEIIEYNNNQGAHQLYKLLDSARLLLTISSTACIDALAAGVPVLSYLPEGFSKVEYHETSVVPIAKTADELSAMTSQLVKHGFNDDFLGRSKAFLNHYLAHRGQAADLAATQFHQLMIQ